MLDALTASGKIKAVGGGRVGQGVVAAEVGEDEGEGEEFDLIVVGGGATGAGIAVDAASRGLKVALLERDDFSAGMLFSIRFLFLFVSE